MKAVGFFLQPIPLYASRFFTTCFFTSRETGFRWSPFPCCKKCTPSQKAVRCHQGWRPFHCKTAALQETRPLRCKNRTIVSFVIYNLPFIISFFFLLAAQRSYNEVVLQRSGLFPYLCSLFKTNVTQRNTIGRRKRNHVATYGRILYHPG